MNLLIVLLVINIVLGDDVDNSEIEIISLEECEIDNPAAANTLICFTELVEDDGIKAFNANVSLNTDFDESFRYNLSFKFPDTSSLRYSMGGDLCKDIPEFLPGLWKKMSEIVGVPEHCPILAGDYKIENFQISAKDSGFPFIINSKISLKIVIFKDDLPVLCRLFTIQSKIMEDK